MSNIFFGRSKKPLHSRIQRSWVRRDLPGFAVGGVCMDPDESPRSLSRKKNRFWEGAAVIRYGDGSFEKRRKVELFFIGRHDKVTGKPMSGRKIVIIYDLKCRDGHKFEGWFKDRGAFEQQREKALIACPVCGNTDAVMVPSSLAIMGRDSHSSAEKPQAGVSSLKILREFQEYIHKNFADVGEKFAEVALRIHHGEEDGRNIRGTTTQNEEQNLRDEGVRFIKLPLPEFDA
jgi:hypothetical protein